MVITVDKNIFVSAFRESYRGDDFSYEALEALFYYYDGLDEECGGTQTELDVVAICCDWCEYDKDMLISDYGYLSERGEEQDDDEYIETLLEELNKVTYVIFVKGGTWLIEAF